MRFNLIGDSNCLIDALRVRMYCGLGMNAAELSKVIMCGDKRKILIIKNDKEMPIGYMAYGLISKYKLSMLSDGRDTQIRHYELNEGNILYIMDLVIAKDHAKLCRHLLFQHLRKYRLVCGFKYEKFRLYLRRGNRRKRVNLLQKRSTEIDCMEYRINKYKY